MADQLFNELGTHKEMQEAGEVLRVSQEATENTWN